MPDPRACPNCGGPTASIEALSGQCPRCLLELARDETNPQERRRFGPFLLVGRIGAGGLGEVHEAIEEATGRRLALKRWSTAGGVASEGPGGRRPWLAADLRHPGIVPVRAHGQSGDTLWVASDLVPRGSLRQEVESAARRGIASPADFQERLVRLVAGAAEALDHAHERGVVHEGIKLDNLLLGDDDRLLLADFAPANSSGLEAVSWLTEPAPRSRAGDVQALARSVGEALGLAGAELASFPRLDASLRPFVSGEGPATARDLQQALLGDPGRRGRRRRS